MADAPPSIFHITSNEQWKTSQLSGSHSDPSLTEEGFIHCSTREQVLGPANRFYEGRQDLVLLRIDTSRLTSELRYEDSYGHGVFPHIYGPLNLEAIVETIEFPCRFDGTFELPADI